MAKTAEIYAGVAIFIVLILAFIMALILYFSAKAARSNNNEERAEKLMYGAVICGCIGAICGALLGAPAFFR